MKCCRRCIVISVIILSFLLPGCSQVASFFSLTPFTPAPTGPISSSPTTPPTTPVYPATGNLTVHFIDVGQGDAILIDLGEYEVLIDAGAKTPGVVGYLSRFVDGPLDVIVATHVHADHIGGLIEVLSRFPVREIWHTGDTATTVTYKNFMVAVNAEGALVRIAERGQTITAGLLTLHILNPPHPLPPEANNTSIVLWLRYGEIDFLFQGDAESAAEASMLAAPQIRIPDCDILKVGHHASRTSSSAAYLDVVRPEVAVYMAASGNTYGHPHSETIAALQNIGARIYGTDVSGSIVIATDGVSFSVSTEK